MSPAPSLSCALAIAALGLAALPGCKGEGAPFTCECDMLTDFDDAHHESVRVCAKSEHEATSAAHGCAQLANPMPVQSCTCHPAADGPQVCREGCLETPR